MSEPKPDTLWFVSPVEREAYERLRAAADELVGENKRLREALRYIAAEAADYGREASEAGGASLYCWKDREASGGE
jgi:hypothetical protein